MSDLFSGARLGEKTGIRLFIAQNDVVVVKARGIIEKINLK
ncbi:hypothetical protein SynBOUM118_01377 [Synechococcus sp. BOUM118]|nr:hypothetical protein SynBOUM118_01377 [Synechococcus sp. BOUM118]